MKLRYDVTFILEIDEPSSFDGLQAEQIVEEAMTTLVDEELKAHHDGATRCGLVFNDAIEFNVQFLEAREEGDGDRRPADVRPVKRGSPPKPPKVRVRTRSKRGGQKGPLST